MPLMTSPTPIRLVSTMGYVVELSDSPSWVPPSLVADCTELGAILAEDTTESEDPTAASKRRSVRKPLQNNGVSS